MPMSVRFRLEALFGQTGSDGEPSLLARTSCSYRVGSDRGTLRHLRVKPLIEEGELLLSDGAGEAGRGRMRGGRQSRTPSSRSSGAERKPAKQGPGR